MSATIRFNGAGGLARFITLPVAPVSLATASAMVHVLAGFAGTAAHEAALDRLAAEAFPRRTWRERLVNPRKHLALLADDLQLHFVRTACPHAGALHGLG